MFLDIRDFTAFAEKRSAEEVVAYLNTIFDEAVDAVTQHQGIVNKFLGDGFMAVFGAPVADAQPLRRTRWTQASRSSTRVERLVARGPHPADARRPRPARGPGGRRQHRLGASARSTRSSATW